VPTIERLVEVFAARYRWGLHPMKLLAALLAPALIVWLADWRLRVRTEAIEEEEARIRRLPRTRRR
jgi:hypothetical protein